MSLIVTRAREAAQDRRRSPGAAKVISDLADEIERLETKMRDREWTQDWNRKRRLSIWRQNGTR